MDKQYSVQFFTKFVEAMQKFCRDYIEFEQAVELSGYLSLEIDNYKKERYVLSEMVHNTGDVISESYCVKAFKTMKRLPQKRDVIRDSTNIKAAGIASSREVTIDLRHSPEPRSSHHTVLQSSFRQRTANSHHLTSGFSKSPSSQPHNNISGHSPLMSSNKRTSFAAGAPNQMAEKHSDSYDSHASGHDNQEIMEIQPRHSIQISTNQTDDVLDNVDTGPFVKDNQSNDVIKSQKRNLTKSDDGPLVKKDKTDGDLDSLINAATRINPISEADSDTLKSVCETETKPSSSDSVHSDNQSISLTSESIRLPLPENIEIKKEVNDIVLLDSPDNGGDNSDLAQLQVTFGVPDSNVSDSTWNTQTQPTTSKPKFAQDSDIKQDESQSGSLTLDAWCKSSYPSSHNVDRGDFQEYSNTLRNYCKYRSMSGKVMTCSVCNYQTTHPYNFKRHQRTHTGDYFHCHLCPRHFTDKGKLRYHIKAHRGELLCRFCFKPFKTQNGQYVHERTCQYAHRRKESS